MKCSRASPPVRILATRATTRRTTRRASRASPRAVHLSRHPSIHRRDVDSDRSRDSNRRPRRRRRRRDSKRVMTRHRDTERVMTRDHGDTRGPRPVSASHDSSLVRDADRIGIAWRRGARRARVRSTTTTIGRRRRRTARVNSSMDVSSCASRRVDYDDDETIRMIRMMMNLGTDENLATTRAKTTNARGERWSWTRNERVGTCDDSAGSNSRRRGKGCGRG